MDILTVFNRDSTRRKYQLKVASYYNGCQFIDELADTRIDGRAKSRVYTNWTRFCVDFHTGFLTTRDINYTMNDSTADKLALDNYQKLYSENDLNSIDAEHLTNCLLYGYSVEVHSFNNGIQITITDPCNWAFINDESGMIVQAIYRVICPAYSYYLGEWLEKDLELYYVYDAEKIQLWQLKDGKLALTTATPHNYGRLPIVVFATSKDNRPIITRNFIRNCDAYDVIRSTNIDDIKYTVDAVLKITGVQWTDILTPRGIQITDPQTGTTTTVYKSVKDILREEKMLLLPKDGADADFISKSVDVEKIKFDLQLSRQNILTQAAIPDLEGLTLQFGNITQISGVALKMRFHNTIMAAGRFTKYFEVGLRDRIKLVNAIWRINKIPELTEYDIKIEQYLPSSTIELMQYIGNLRGLVPDKDLLKAIDFIERPEEAYRELLNQRTLENGNQPGATTG